jgi:hypothetical protein
LINNNNIEIKNKISKYDIFPDKIYQLFWTSNSFDLNKTIKNNLHHFKNKNVLVYNHIDLVSLKIYLKLHNVNFNYIHFDHKNQLKDEFLKNDTSIILTSTKNTLLKELNTYPEIKSTYVLDYQYPVTNIIMIVKNKSFD